MDKLPENQLLDWAVRLQAIAQNGLAYTENIYDIERWEQLRDISAEMISWQYDTPIEKVKEVFCFEKGYQTPKIDTRGVIVKDGKILLVQESTGEWAMPGGWVDVYESIGESVVKEVWEEAGLQAKAERIIAVQDRDKRNPPPFIYKICKIFVLCTALGGEFKPNSETLASGYFGPDGLPKLCTAKTTEQQIRMCLAAAEDENWRVQFD